MQLLHDTGVEPEIRLYLHDPLNARELSQLIKKLKIKPVDLVRKEEPVYKDEYKGLELNDQQWIEAMVAHPKLIQRPIGIVGDRAVVGRPPELVLNLVKGGA